MKKLQNDFRKSNSLEHDLTRWLDVLSDEKVLLDKKLSFVLSNAKNGNKTEVNEKLEELEECLISIEDVAEEACGVEVERLDSARNLMDNLNGIMNDIKDFNIALRDFWKAKDYSKGEVAQEVQKTFNNKFQLFRNEIGQIETAVQDMIMEMEDLKSNITSLSEKKIL